MQVVPGIGCRGEDAFDVVESSESGKSFSDKGFTHTVGAPASDKYY